MAMKRSIFALLWFIAYVCAQDIVLPALRPEITRFIPSCAQQCFRSFLAVNYGLNPCGRLPSLQCLCRRSGATGFTISEGALQCIVAERDLGSCSPFEASDSVVRSAFGICDNIEDAVLPTHTVITATVVLPPSGSGAVTVPPLQTSSRTSSRTTSAASTTTRSPSSTSTSTSTTRSRFSSSASTLTTSTRPASTVTQTATETPIVPPPTGGSSDKATNSEKLNTGQVVGISIGVAAAAAVAVGAIFLARYYRRKKYPNLKTGFFPSRETWGYNVEKGAGNDSNTWLARQTAAAGLHDPVPPPPPTYARQTWRPSGAATTSSPASSQKRKATQTPPSRRTSRLLPAKPILALAVPKQTPSPSSSGSQSRSSPAGKSPGRQSPGKPMAGKRSPGRHSPARPSPPSKQAAIPKPPTAASSGRPRAPTQLKLQIPKQENPLPPLPLAQNRRESTMTEFEEDGGNSTSPSAQIWRLPSAGPLSATTYYIADKNGNWVLGGPKSASHVAELDGSPAEPPKSSTVYKRPALPQAKSDKSQSSASSSESKAAPRQSLAPAAEIKSASELAISPPDTYTTDATVPRPLFSSNRESRRQPRRQSTSRTFGRPRAASTDSGVTTICTSPEDANGMELPMPMPLAPSMPKQPNYLSPVVESPNATNKSARPDLNEPGRHKDVAAGRNLNILPPNKRNLLYSPPGQPSPTLGIMQSGRNPNVPSETRGPENKRASVPGPRAPMQNPGLVRTGSPTMRVVRASPEVDDRTRLPSVRPSRAQQPQPQQAYSQPQQKPYQQQQQQQQQQQRPYPYPQQQRPYQPYQRQAPYPYQQPQRQGPYPGAYPYPYPYPQQQQQQQQRQQPYFPFREQPSRRGPHPLSNVSNIPPPLRTSFQGPPRQPIPTQDGQPLQPPPPATDLHSPTSERTASTGSLLAKRVGTDRAANMAIPTANYPSAANRWRRDAPEPPPGVIPMTPRFPGDLPSTPTWVPRLTPTRRGDDLFLNVQ